MMDRSNAAGRKLHTCQELSVLATNIRNFWISTINHRSDHVIKLTVAIPELAVRPVPVLL